jgi:hypothetical protein
MDPSSSLPLIFTGLKGSPCLKAVMALFRILNLLVSKKKRKKPVIRVTKSVSTKVINATRA